jgi:hypothetical protein
LEELKKNRLKLLARKSKDFNTGKIKEFLDALRTRKEGFFWPVSKISSK